MEREKLEKELVQLQEELEDVKEEMHFMLEKTNIHVPGSAKNQFEEQIRVLEEKIQKIKDQLKED